ncbi:MAG: adenine-specific DNA-methyltransferase [Gaiellales bacterium]|jgi:adenine-specific DNA-methyltransferase|nr:adenine-specific DNA-methyltransferase [Gaiellales bacterium]
MIKYIGSKRILAPLLAEIVAGLGVASAADLFAGTTRVGQALRRAGVRVVSNDTASYSEMLGRAYIEAGPEVDRERLRALIGELDALPGRRGYVTETFCERSRFFQPENGMRIDAIRAGIDALTITDVERGLLLTSLIEGADRVDSTVGLQMAYLKSWAPRAANRLELREPDAVEGPAGRVLRRDANELGDELAGIDLAYVDPPYNQHSYYANYHVWETIVRNDAPRHYGVACKREDVRQTKSAYNSRRTAWAALAGLIERLPTPWIVVSFSNEGFHDLAAVHALLAARGHVGRLDVDSRRYVGAKIGIHNPSGRRVGSVSHLRNTEAVFVCGPDRDLVERVTRHQADVAHAI